MKEQFVRISEILPKTARVDAPLIMAMLAASSSAKTPGRKDANTPKIRILWTPMARVLLSDENATTSHPQMSQMSRPKQRFRS